MWRLAILLTAILAATAGGALYWHLNNAPEVATLDDISLPDINKTLRHGAEWRGKVVIVNHWAAWCAPCIEEVPLLIEYQNHMRARGVQIIGIAHDTIEPTKIFGDAVGINYPSLVAITDGGELMRQQGNVTGALPFTVVFGRDGERRVMQLGTVTWEHLDTMVAPLL